MQHWDYLQINTKSRKVEKMIGTLLKKSGVIVMSVSFYPPVE